MHLARHSSPVPPQRGAILLMTLIALVILMISAVAVVRSFDSSVLLSGNLSFKRDLVNQGERGMAAAFALLASGALATETARTANSLGNNYSAAMLASNSRGIPPGSGATAPKSMIAILLPGSSMKLPGCGSPCSISTRRGASSVSSKSR